MTTQEVMEKTCRKLGEADRSGAQGALDYIRESRQSPWKSAILDIISDAIGRNGWEGIEMARKAAEDIVDDKNPDLSFLSLRHRSDILCLRQMCEADRKDRVNDFFVAVGHIVGKIMRAVICSV